MTADLIDNSLALSEAIKKIRHGQLVAMNFAVEPMLENEEELQQYFESEFGSQTDIDMEKTVAAAVTRSIYASKLFPKAEKKDIARAMTATTIELMRYGKLDYHYSTERISAREYDRRMRENNVAQRITQVRKIRNGMMRQGIKIAISAGAAALAHSAATTAATTAIAGLAGLAGATSAAIPVVAAVGTFAVLTLGSKLLPKKVREPLENKFDQIQERICDVAADAARTLQRHIESAAERIIPVIEKAKDISRNVGRALSRARDRAVESLGKAKAKAMSWLGL